MIPTIHLDVMAAAIVDTHDTNQEAAWGMIASLRHACRHVGFFYLQGHGVDPALLHAVLTQTRMLFAESLTSKQTWSDPVTNRGYTAWGEETLDPEHQTQGDTKEGYYIGVDVAMDDPRYNPAKLRVPNIWPSTTATLDTSLFRTVMKDYFAAVSHVGLQLTRCLALAIGLEDAHFFDDAFMDPMAMLRLLHYAATPSRPDEGVYACGAHSDYGMITLLLTDDTPGLQIYQRKSIPSDDNKGSEKEGEEDGTWIDVPPRPDAFVVNLGDMLERWTNGLFASTKHRVVVQDASKERYSIPFFYEPQFDTRVECLPLCCSPERPPRYPPTTSGEHLLSKYQQTHADFAPTAASTVPHE
jgi:isopenicillin N synthase-like dioxygenase